MRIAICAFSVLFLCAVPATAQSQPGEAVHLELHPKANELPSLKYRLLPPESELVPGNRATGYYRVLAMFYENSQALAEIKKEYWSKWESLPLKEFPLEDAKTKLATFTRHFSHELNVAAHKQRCDWELDGRPEGIGLLLPEVQGYRSLATVLAVKVRAEIGEGKFDTAIQTLQSGYALARDLGDGPTFIHILVGAAVANTMNRQVELLIQQPGAPNLYWALTTLPRPFFTLDHALREDQTMVLRILPWLNSLENGPMSEEQVKIVQEQTRKVLDDFGVKWRDNYEAAKKVMMEGAFTLAKNALLEHGMTAAKIDAMPKFQVVALNAVRQYRLASAEVAKWNHIPNGWRNANYLEDAKRYTEAYARLDLLFFDGLLRALGNGHDPEAPHIAKAIGRTDRQIAALRCIEALRAYAAEHGGELPTNLADVTKLPVPPDPVLLKPFEYKVSDGKQATLSAAAPPGEKDTRNMTLKYELTLLPAK